MKPKSIGFSVWLMAGTSDTMASHKRKNPRNTPSATNSIRRSARRKVQMSCHCLRQANPGGHRAQGQDCKYGEAGVGDKVSQPENPKDVGEEAQGQRLGQGIAPVRQTVEQGEGQGEGPLPPAVRRPVTRRRRRPWLMPTAEMAPEVRPQAQETGASKESTNSRASNGARSSRSSPVPINRMGT